MVLLPTAYQAQVRGRGPRTHWEVWSGLVQEGNFAYKYRIVRHPARVALVVSGRFAIVFKDVTERRRMFETGRSARSDRAAAATLASDRLASLFRSGYIRAMRRFPVGHLTLLCLTLVAVSTDSATKVMHGVSHSRQAHELTEHGLVAHHHGPAADAAEHQSSADDPDADAEHFALHGVVTATVLPSILMVASAIVDAPIAEVNAERNALHCPNAQAAPPWVCARPVQPRAPPLG